MSGKKHQKKNRRPKLLAMVALTSGPNGRQPREGLVHRQASEGPGRGEEAPRSESIGMKTYRKRGTVTAVLNYETRTMRVG